jgi:hypothetical protein
VRHGSSEVMPFFSLSDIVRIQLYIIHAAVRIATGFFQQKNQKENPQEKFEYFFNFDEFG